ADKASRSFQDGPRPDTMFPVAREAVGDARVHRARRGAGPSNREEFAMAVGFDQPLYILPFDHRGSFQTKMFGWKGTLTPEQTAQVAAAKQVIYDGFKVALAGGVPQDKAGILVDEQFGSAILQDCRKHGYSTSCPAEKSAQDEVDFEDREG